MKQDNIVFSILLGLGFCLVWWHGTDRVHPTSVESGAPSPRRHVLPIAIDPLTADVRTLLHLPGIGPKLARPLHHQSRVLELDSLDQLERIKGIGPNRAQAIRDAVHDFEDNATNVP